MQIVSTGDNLHKMSNPFSGKNKKTLKNFTEIANVNTTNILISPTAVLSHSNRCKQNMVVPDMAVT